MTSGPQGLRLGTTLFSFTNEYHSRRCTVEQTDRQDRRARPRPRPRDTRVLAHPRVSAGLEQLRQHVPPGDRAQQPRAVVPLDELRHDDPSHPADDARRIVRVPQGADRDRGQAGTAGRQDAGDGGSATHGAAGPAGREAGREGRRGGAYSRSRRFAQRHRLPRGLRQDRFALPGLRARFRRIGDVGPAVLRRQLPRDGHPRGVHPDRTRCVGVRWVLPREDRPLPAERAGRRRDRLPTSAPCS